MSQSNFGNIESPQSGTDFFNNKLEPWRDALHSCHSGSNRPSYAVSGMLWINNTTNPWVLNVFDGAQDIPLGSINTTTNVFTASGIDVSNVSGISTFVQTLMDDTSAAAFLATLGIATASQSEAEAGTNNTKYTTPLRVFQAIAAKVSSMLGFVKYFESTGQSLAAASATGAIAHGLGSVPKFVYVAIICNTASNGFTAGQEVTHFLVNTEGPGAISSGIVVWYDNTNVYGKVANNAQFLTIDMTSGARTALTVANFSYKIRAWG